MGVLYQFYFFYVLILILSYKWYVKLSSIIVMLILSFYFLVNYGVVLPLVIVYC
jgi:hypothetical protein